MKQREIITRIGLEAGITQDKAHKALKALIGIIRGEVQASGRLAIADLGIFEKQMLAARVICNPLTEGAKINIPEKYRIKFRPTVAWKEAVNLK